MLLGALNQNYPKVVIAVVIALIAGITSFSQSSIDSLLQRINPDRWSAFVEKKAHRLEDKIVAKSEKTLLRLKKQEEKIYKKQLATKDSLSAKAKLLEIQTKYEALLNKLKNPAVSLPKAAKQYLPHLDTVKTALKFLNQNGNSGNITNSLSQIESFDERMLQTNEIKNFIRERRQQVKQELERLGLTKELKKLNKEVYYYSAQISEYRNIFNDEKKIEQKAISLLSKLSAFKEFMAKNSELASLFQAPGSNYSTVQGATGLQSRSQMMSYIQNQTGLTSYNTQSLVKKNLQSAEGQINALRSKLTSNGGGDLEMPDFKPNNQHTKSFFQRLEYGTNLQTAKSNSFFPITTDLGLSVAYRLNDKNVVGLGASYKIGWGRNISHIKVSSEGIGFRSFADFNIKRSLFLSGGLEYNYQQPFNSISIVNRLDSWQKSGLVGLSKIVSLNTKVFKKTKIQLLWDFLSYQQKPKGQAIKFRIGYNF